MADHVFLIIIDGLRKDCLEMYLSMLSDPASDPTSNSGFRLIGLDRKNDPFNTIKVKSASTVFPSFTICANASIVTGLYPCHHGITGNIFYDFDQDLFIDFTSRQLGPTIYGYYDDKRFYEEPTPWYKRENAAAAAYGHQKTGPGCSGPDRILFANGISTVYDILTENGFPSHVTYHFYSKGAGYNLDEDNPLGEALDGWDVPNVRSLFFLIPGENNAKVFFDSLDKPAGESATNFITRFPPGTNYKFPSLFTLYYSSLDHACHVNGIRYEEGHSDKNSQTIYLREIDMLLYDIIDAYKKKFPGEFDNTVFIITSDHGHSKVDPSTIFNPNDIVNSMRYGLFSVIDYDISDASYIQSNPSYYITDVIPHDAIWEEMLQWGALSSYNFNQNIIYAKNGGMIHVYIKDEAKQKYGIRFFERLLGNLLSNLGFGENTKKATWQHLLNESETTIERKVYESFPLNQISAVIAKLPVPGSEYYKWNVRITEEREGTSNYAYKYSYTLVPHEDEQTKLINKMLNNGTSSGDFIILVNQEDKWQFAYDAPHADFKSIEIDGLKDWIVMSIVNALGDINLPTGDYRLSLRIPFTDVFNSESTHGGFDTMEVPMIFAGRCIPQSDDINKANVVDIVPTILNILGIPISKSMDGISLLDNRIRIIPRSIREALRHLGYQDSILSIASISMDMELGYPFSLQEIYEKSELSR